MTAPHGLCRLAPVRGPLVDWQSAVVLDLQPVRPDPERPTLTGRQQRMLTFIRDYIHRHGYSPTVREIADGSGLWSASSAVYQLGQLEAKGYIERGESCRRSRALRLVQGVAG